MIGEISLISLKEDDKNLKRFEAVGHSQEAKKLMKTLQIGKLLSQTNTTTSTSGGDGGEGGIEEGGVGGTLR